MITVLTNQDLLLVLVLCFCYGDQLNKIWSLEKKMQQQNETIECFQKDKDKTKVQKLSKYVKPQMHDYSKLTECYNCDVKNAYLASLREERRNFELRLTKLEMNEKRRRTFIESWVRLSKSLTKEIHNQETKLQTCTNDKKESSMELHKSTDKDLTSTDKEIINIKSDIRNMNESHQQLSKRCNEINETLSKNKRSLSQTVNNMTTFDSKLVSMENNITQSTILINGTRIHIQLLEEYIARSNNSLNHTRIRLSNLEENVTDTNILLNGTQVNIQHLEENIAQSNTLLKLTHNRVSHLEENVTRSSILVNRNKGDIRHLEGWSSARFMIGGVVIFLGIIVIYMTYSDIRQNIHYLLVNKDKPILKLDSLSIIGKVKRKDAYALDNQFCIISFNEATHYRHRSIVKACLEGGRRREKNMTETTFIVKEHKDVLEIPSVKVVLVFIDYNQLNIILETPGLDKDDVKLLTVQASRKIGADVFVIYVGDEGSKSLMPGLLYNPQLTTVVEHFELKPLEQQDRVITLHEKFTITQREKVAEVIA